MEDGSKPATHRMRLPRTLEHLKAVCRAAQAQGKPIVWKQA